ncbi:MAG: CapA family protein [Prevotella sp.]|nr:CapA family protein [Prevotella sp.]
MTLQFIGDLIFGDQPVKFGYGFDSMHSDRRYEVFSSVSALLNGCPTIANFEAIIQPRPSKSTISNWSMCCDESAAVAVRNAGISVVNVANNHTMDYGEDAFLYTVDCLRQNGLQIIGLREHPYVILEAEGERCAVVGVSYLKVRALHPLYFYNPSNDEWQQVIHEINNQGVNQIVIYVHWGSEFIYLPTEKQLEIAKNLTHLPVQAVIGHHPHILQTSGLVNEVPVFFSLGNFASDYWQERARESSILCMELDNGSPLFKEYPCMLDVYGCPKISGECRTVILKDYNGDISTNMHVHHERSRLRKEYMVEFVRHFYKIKNKTAYLKWVLRRLWFILKYGRAEKNNPELVYEKYKS